MEPNNKNMEALSPLGAPSAPTYHDDSTATAAAGGGSSNVPYAMHVDAAQYQQPTHAAAPRPQHQQVAPTSSTHEWKIDFCNCLSTPAHCCMSFFVPCVNAAYAANGIGQPGVLVGLVFFVLYVGWAALAGGSSSESSGATFGVAAFICILGFVVATTMLRHAVRHFDSIPGSAMTDVCLSFWCTCCVLSQLSAHTERMKPLRNLNAATLQAYNAA